MLVHAEVERTKAYAESSASRLALFKAVNETAVMTESQLARNGVLHCRLARDIKACELLHSVYLPGGLITGESHPGGSKVKERQHQVIHALP